MGRPVAVAGLQRHRSATAAPPGRRCGRAHGDPFRAR
ncbi:hypothetical protein Ae406Ps2_0318 [Pseudonocardia sp. Ae406_Ps2]|nr:hypothetical protein Ae406Ps2_0318 [Pseudonocardia sp. Ae406_Ps2]OLM07891.1 hypothetical protein Ae331Ps2_5601c [Pseudonocardia sp. Ae331_Ps2]OLM13858.1 hypothetical protein Ae505Ps2_3987 [Pseudonocardia sp. Ae505_Ps2]OLM21887.1 hypothetical protein Ae706Ps2_0319 [Pseudonocardia sp. Ae706_Ps2]